MGKNPEDHLDGCELDFNEDPDTTPEEVEPLLVAEGDEEDEEGDL
jgi:hypothetical protein